ncbi:MAG: hypothetical protein NTZ98_04325, partial [Acidobacteria bacterium]|nr:hypothetical protein [Acidobacteriota bacterium]
PHRRHHQHRHAEAEPVGADVPQQAEQFRHEAFILTHHQGTKGTKSTKKTAFVSFVFLVPWR